MFAVHGSIIVFRPELDLRDDLAVMNGRKRNRSCRQGSIVDGDTAHGFRFVAHYSVDGEPPPAMRRIFLVHRRKVLPASDSFLRLRPLENVVVTEHPARSSVKQIVVRALKEFG